MKYSTAIHHAINEYATVIEEIVEPVIELKVEIPEPVLEEIRPVKQRRTSISFSNPLEFYQSMEAIPPIEVAGETFISVAEETPISVAEETPPELGTVYPIFSNNNFDYDIIPEPPDAVNPEEINL
jgi:hypothetical protein